MNSYWLSRSGSSDLEGPFSLGQLEGMYARGDLTQRARVCLLETEDWRFIGEEIEAVRQLKNTSPKPTPPPIPKGQFHTQGQAWRRTVDLLCTICIVFAAVPVVGLFAWWLYGVALIVCLVLCVLLFVRGEVRDGLWGLLFTFVFTPLGIALMNVIASVVLAAVLGHEKA